MDRQAETENSRKDVQAKGKGRHTEATAQFNNTKTLSSFFFSSHSTVGLFREEHQRALRLRCNNSTKGLKKRNC